jgi:hypothetical protein
LSRNAAATILALLLLLAPGVVAAQPQALPGKAVAAPAADALGDLSAFRDIAEQILTNVKTGDLTAARKRVKDLETAWDDAEDKLRPRNPEKWKLVDKAIDRALQQLRAATPDATGCSLSLQNVIVVIDAQRG